MNTRYKDLCNIFFNKIKDYSLASLDEETAYEIATNYIASACLRFESCTQDLENRDDLLQEFEMQITPNNLEILTNYMVVEWIDREFVHTTSALKSRLSSSDFKSLNLQQQLTKALEVRSTLLSENDRLSINKSYSPKTSKLYDIATGRKKV